MSHFYVMFWEKKVIKQIVLQKLLKVFSFEVWLTTHECMTLLTLIFHYTFKNIKKYSIFYS